MMPGRRALSRWGSAGALALLGTWAAWLVVRWYLPNHGDDTFITLRYATRLAHGRGLTWNDGYRVEGFSSPLWVAVVALASALGFDPLLAARNLSLWLALACVPLACLGVTRCRGTLGGWHAVALTMPLVTIGFCEWAPTGMDATPYAFSLLAAVVAYGWGAHPLRGRARWVAFACAGLGALTRPEGILVASALVVLDLGVVWRLRPWRRSAERRQWLWPCAAALGPFLVYVIFRRIYFAEWLPNTALAKLGSDERTFRGIAYVKHLVVENASTALLLPALLVGPVIACGKGRAARMAGAAAVLTFAQLAAILYMGGDWMGPWRLLVPVAFPVAIAVVCVVGRLSSRCRRELHGPIAASLLVACLWVPHGVGVDVWVRSWRGENMGPALSVEGEMNTAHRDLAEWLREHASAADLVAVNHAGAVPYYSGLPSLDMTGLSDVHITHHAHGDVHELHDADYVIACRPRFIVLNTYTRPTDERWYSPDYWEGESELYGHGEFARLYAPMHQVWPWRDHGTTKYTVIFQRRTRAETRPQGEHGKDCWRAPR